MTTTPPRVYYDGNGTAYDDALQRTGTSQRNLWQEWLSWRRSCFALMGLVALLIGLVFFVVKRSTYEVNFVTVNTEGQLAIVGWDTYDPTTEEIKQDLMRWLRCARGLPTSESILEYCWTIVPMFLLEKSQALQTVASYYKQLNPKALLYRKEIEVNHLKGWQHPDGRWQLTWVEDVYDVPKSGGIGRREMSTQMSAIMLVTRRKPTSKKQTHLNGEPVNPRGVFVTHLSFGE